MTSYEEFLQKTEEFMFISDQPEKADIIFIPGNGYPHMEEKAADLYKKGFAPYILPSGKYSITAGKFSGVLLKEAVYDKEYQTEWQFLKDVLMQNGVREKDILKEEKATFTWENALYSRKVTDEAGLSIKKAILCCKSYHARRVLMYYQRAYPETEFLVCPSFPDGISLENWRESQKGIQEVMGEVSRIISQFSLMMD